MKNHAQGLNDWFDLTFIGHGHCYLWRADLVLLHSVSDALIAAAYFTIPFALYVLMKKRKDLEYKWMFVLFAIFIFACGATHVFAIWNIWNGHYYLSGAVKALTAVVSVATAILVWPLIPKVLALPRPMELQQANIDLKSEIALRRSSEANLLSTKNELQRHLAELLEVKKRLETEIAHRKMAEEREKAKAIALRASNEELEQFAFVASHDLREPLRKLLSFTQLLMSGKYGNFDQRGEQFVSYIRDAATRMETLINSLLAYSRVTTQNSEHEYVLVNELFEETERDLQLRIEESHATIHKEITGEIKGNKAQLRQLAQNLVSNALKYRSPDASPVITIKGGAISDDTYRLTVSDNGIGFDPQYKDQIFEVFKRLHGRSEYEGTGMGLAICKKVVERHGGIITADSEVGKGSTFQIDLPLSKSKRGNL
ncbi:sensor histidine kinase [Marinobacter sp. LQ44]|uniref:sensor histidine kinase n=1 Tax=unclassified Marinobacter TaxID=83889 RepID=UPI000719044A|nr:ATP-binding protein [Marinobacter sp. LQ44]AMQ90663.1 hypothetical protein ASQ50_19295 [Marinobacter sp. LQ44]